MRIALALSLLMACHHADGQSSFGRVLSRGGELANVPLDEQKLRVGDSTVTAWGLLEVPDGSRIQTAYAGVDAIARAELLKFIRVRVEDLMVSVDSTDPARREVYEHTVETVQGSLRHVGTTRHGWERVQHDDRIIVRIWSELSVPRADVESAMQAVRAP